MTQAEKVFRKLNEVGFSEAYVRSMLPSWWEDRVSENPAGLSEFNLALSRNFGIEIEGLSAEEPHIEFRLPGTQKLKRSVKYDESQLAPAVSIALSAAKIAVHGMRNPYLPLPPAKELRQRILDNGAQYVSLKALLRVCWTHGIPVLHVSQFPDGMPKMDGLAAMINDRPAIVISKNTQFSAWMSFVVAHEMGHVANSHCTNGEMIIDEALDESIHGDAGLDEQEREADNFAMELLSGDFDIDRLSSSATSSESLAHAAMAIQRAKGIDAGHLILRYAYQSKTWPLAIAALKALDVTHSAQSDMLVPLEYELNTDVLSPGAIAFLFRVCGVPVFD